MFLASGRDDALTGRHVGQGIMQGLVSPGTKYQIVQNDLRVLWFRREIHR